MLAEANYTASVATYRQVIGVESGQARAGTPVDRFSPHNLPGAVAVGTATNPAVTTAEYNVDVALQAVKVAEGALYPTVSVQGSYTQELAEPSAASTPSNSYNASVLGTLSVPIYQGGAEYSLIRQAKETLGQKRLDLDTARDTVRQNVVQAWGQLDAAKANIDATQAQVQAAEIALNGVREEARVGQRTTFDVLDAQQALVNARVALVTAQHDRVVASYTLLSAVGRLSPQVLGLRVPVYDATVHYQQVRDSWAGVRNPGRALNGGAARSGASVHSSLHSAAFRPATPACPWRIKETQATIRSRSDDGRAARRAGCGSCGRDYWNEPSGKGPRALDGGNPGLHPAHYCR